VPRSPSTTRLALQVCIALGGCAALSWEVLWQIESSLALGVSARGTAITLATTMAGMGAGSLLAGRWLARRRVARPLRLYGRLEAAIGLAGLALPFGFAALERLDGWLYRLEPALASPLHTLGIALLLGPAALAMGATVPVFGLLAPRFGVPLSRLYAVNTAGAALGVLGFTFAVVPALGLLLTILAIAGLDFAVCLAAHALPEPESEGDGAQPAAEPEVVAPRVPPLPLAIAAATGFATFGLEVAWFRSLRAAFQSSADSFAIILASVLVPLALGARLAPRLRARGLSPAPLLAAAGVAILLATPIVERIDLIDRALPELFSGGTAYVLQQIRRFLLGLAILGPPVFVLGTVLPWLLDEWSHPSAAGRLYGANTVGAACGSLATAWLLLPAFGFARSAWGLGLLIVALACWAATPRTRGLAAAAGCAALVVAVLGTSSPGRERVQAPYPWESVEILVHEEGPDSTVSVVEADATRYLLIDGFAASGEDLTWGPYMDRMGRLPMLVHPDPRRALVIGFGTGQTAHAVRDEEPDELQIVELDRAVLDAAPWFETNHGVLDDPSVSTAVMDGRAWLRRQPRSYDVITLEPMPPHFAGVNALYSRDFYEILAQRLEPGGIACQWVPLHLLPPRYAASVTRTFQSVFPDAEMWVIPNAQGVLLGRKRAPGDAPEALPRLAMRHFTERLVDDTRLRLGPRALERFGDEGEVISDDNQLLAFGRLAPEMWLYGTLNQVIARNLERVRRLARPIQD